MNCPLLNNSKFENRTQEKANSSKVKQQEEYEDEYSGFIADDVGEKSSENLWVVDSGATTHMCNSSEVFAELHESSSRSQIEVANGEKVQRRRCSESYSA